MFLPRIPREGTQMWVSQQFRQGAWLRISIGAFLICAAAMLAVALPSASSAEASKSYIVVLNDDVAHPANVAHRHEENRGAELDHIYKAAIKGYSAVLTADELKAIKQDPNVDYVDPDD